MAKSNIKNINNYLFWKTPDYSYNFKQSNSIYFHYFFSFYLTIAGFFFNTLIYRNVYVYKKFITKNIEFLKIKKPKLKRKKNLHTTNNSIFLIKKKPNSLLKDIYIKNKKKKNISILNFDRVDNFLKKSFKYFFLYIYKYNKNLLKKKNIYKYSFKEEKNVGNLQQTAFKRTKRFVPKKNYFFNITREKDCFVFVLRFFYINSKLNIVLYFNKLVTYLKFFKNFNLYKRFPVVQINALYLYKEITKYRRYNNLNYIQIKNKKVYYFKKNLKKFNTFNKS